MEISAKLKNIRVSPTKIRLVANLIRKMEAKKALEQLPFVRKGCKDIVLGLLKSAIANAENTYNCQLDNLYIAKVSVDEAQTLKRWRARAFGRSAPIRKRGSQMTIVLREIVPTEPKEVKAEAIAAPVAAMAPTGDLPNETYTAKGGKIAEAELDHQTNLEKSFDGGNLGKHDAIDKPRSEVKSTTRKVFRRKSGL